jgi:hypothetical protein
MAVVRSPLYEEIADLALDTNNQRVRNVALKLRELLEEQGLLPLQGA